ncbi:HNH endonuclease [Acinetobacter oleivorans]
MSNSVNRFGLSRTIPSPIKRSVRQRDRFGCILCALPFIQYEHVDPLFCDAQAHLVKGITLLCPTCHAKVTSRQISKTLIKRAMENPKAKELKKVSDTLLFTENHPTVKIGGVTFEKCKTILRCQGEDIFSIAEESGRYFINAKFWDSSGKQNLTIVNNEWVVQTDNIWDLEVKGNTVIIREKFKKPSLIFSLSENNTLTIDKIDMIVKGVSLVGDSNVLKVDSRSISMVDVSDCDVGFDI